MYPSVTFLSNIFGGVPSQNKLLCEAEVEAAGSVIFSPLELHPSACLLYSFDISFNHIATNQKQKTAERTRESVQESTKIEKAAEFFTR